MPRPTICASSAANAWIRLYTASIVALHADTGRMAWYYQTTPRDSWDFDSVQKLCSRICKIGGRQRAVIMQANKNGFFYVLDRENGKLISANNFAYINWATHVDLKTGRPVVTAEANWYAKPKTMYPSWSGAPHLESDVVQPADAPGLHPGHRRAGRLGRHAAQRRRGDSFIDGFFTVNGVYRRMTPTTPRSSRACTARCRTWRPSGPRARSNRRANCCAPWIR